MAYLSDILLWIAAISAGLMAGVFFTFSAFVMRSLDAIKAPAGMLAMQSINRIIVKSSFLPIFFVSTIACAVLVVIAALDLGAAGAIWTLSGSAAYVVGMFVVTIAGNVPLNNRLEATPADGQEGAEMWAEYLRKWMIWNHVRTIACTGSLILLVLAIAERL
ncbi:anthrone oxygenase family protein [Parerythrobacter aestuarii]|uniref:anthrone oxygenase family protein n=1 Tax=Parerythrobacter aestuarii TaxID=3020909 RepID=UPI0024DEBAA0|nr:anthrone oxygenase family protein [Parerythrobacter aestuarii]